ncbi:MAG: hypothetical protein AB7F23_03075 [Phycisphaerae bacterium]
MAEEMNIALHKKYTLAPNPDFSLTTDPSDYIQLTDGKTAGSLWYEDYRGNTVGWGGASLIEITIDLMYVSNISKVRLYTVGGGRALVEYPEYVVVLGSQYGTEYNLMSFADTDGWAFGNESGADSRVSRVLEVEVAGKCRYIRLLVRPVSLFFTDEIQIIDSGVESAEKEGGAVTDCEAIDIVERYRQLNRNVSALREAYLKCDTDIAQFVEKLDAFIEELERCALKLSDTEKFLSLERLFDRIRAEYYTSVYEKEWFCDVTDPMNVLKYQDVHEKTTKEFLLDLYLWQNENAIAAFDIVNCSDAQKQYSLDFSPLTKDGDFIPSKPFMLARRALYIYSKNSGFFADPLVLQGKKTFNIRPGETVQIVIEANSRGLGGGIYHGAIMVSCHNSSTKPMCTININMEVVDKVFPAEVDFMTLNWDFLTDRNRFTSDCINFASDDLARHYTNVSVVGTSWFCLRNPDASSVFDRAYVNPQITKVFELLPYARVKLLSLGFKHTNADVFGEDIASLDWEIAFKVYVRKLVDVLKEAGIKYEDYALYPYDERLDEDFLRVAQVIKEADANVQIFANWVGNGLNDIRNAKGLVDIWCPQISDVQEHPEYVEELQSYGCAVWSYGGASKRAYVTEQSKRRFYRMGPVDAVAAGVEGAGYWVYTEPSKQATGIGFSECYVKGYGIVYDGELAPKDSVFEPIVPSIRWELWREGVEDAVALRKSLAEEPEFRNILQATETSDSMVRLRKIADREQ